MIQLIAVCVCHGTKLALGVPQHRQINEQIGSQLIACMHLTQAVWKDVSKHRRVAIFSVFAAAFVASSAFGGLGTFTNVREHNGRVSITIGAPHEVRC